MSDIKTFLELIETILKLIFGDQVPSWIPPFIGYMALIVLALSFLWLVLNAISKIIEVWLDKFWPLFYNKEEKRRIERRRRFAEHIESEVRRLNNLEEWRDYHFAELEAEVEAEGRKKVFSFIPFIEQTRENTKREKSLSRALSVSKERLILLEGDPGAGKSIALRHVALLLARKAKEAKSAKSVIPIYINLKELERHKGDSVDRNLIQDFIISALNRVNDRDIEVFLEEEFVRGLREKSWLFLFDSFDELPEVLSSTEVDDIIQKYAQAIADFLQGMNQCRGVIASRHFRGPNMFGWPRFRVLSLSEERQLDLIHKADLKSELEEKLIADLKVTSEEVRSMVTNPMFLGLLCEYVKKHRQLPSSVHTIFEGYISDRFTRDEERVQRKFGLDIEEVREVAEKAAFCMTGAPNLGLSPTRDDIRDSFGKFGFQNPTHFDSALDALEYIKLARSEMLIAIDRQSFTFAHRRFQEYFATCTVLSEPQLIEPYQLLTDARWRETAVTMCQTQPTNQLAQVIDTVEKIITDIKTTTPNLIDQPLDYISRNAPGKDAGSHISAKYTLKKYSWPPKVLHLFAILQEAFSRRIEDLPENIREDIGIILLSASQQGVLIDRKWTLEVAGIAPYPIFVWLLRDALSESAWLKEVTYRQVAKLTNLPDDVIRWIRQNLVSMALNKRLYKERITTHAHLSQIDRFSELQSVIRLLLWYKQVGFIMSCGLLLYLLISPTYGEIPTQFRVVITTLIVWLLYLLSYSLFAPTHKYEVEPKDAILEVVMVSYMSIFFFVAYYLVGININGWHLIFTIYVLLWPGLALLSALTLKPIHPLHFLAWPLIPVLVPIHLLLDFFSNFSTIR